MVTKFQNSLKTDIENSPFPYEKKISNLSRGWRGVPVDFYSNNREEISKTMGQNNWTPLTLLWKITLNTSDHSRYSLFTPPRGFYPIWPKFTYRALSPLHPFSKKKFSNVNNVRVERVPKPTFLASIFGKISVYFFVCESNLGLLM